MPLKTRREFLYSTATAASAIALLGGSAAWSQAAPPRFIRGWITSGTQRLAQFDVSGWHTSSSSYNNDIVIDPAIRRQSILGFGAAFTDASCYLLSQLSEKDRRTLLEDLFGPKGLRLSVGRTCIGASDYSRNVYSYDDSLEPDPELKHFSIEHDRAYILPLLRNARYINPELFLFSSPWSPPGWMKSSQSMLGGAMRKAYFGAYADYFVHYLKDYLAQGVKINAVTVQNEVDTDQDGKMPAALWGQEYEAAFVGEFLGPALERASLDTKIWILDHNYSLWGRALDELSIPLENKYVDGVAWHGYVGDVAAMSRVHDAFPEKNAYWTEGGPDISASDYATDWSKWSQTFTGVLRNWGRCLVGWNIVLDEQGKPNVGPFSCGGLVTMDSRTQRITRSGQYWAFSHFSKAIRRDARVLASHGQVAGIEHVALENPDGGRVLILTNQGDARSLDCGLAGSSLRVQMPKDSVATLVWQS